MKPATEVTVDKPSLGLPWTLEGSHPWQIMCETNIPGMKNVVATVAYRPMAELIVRAVNQSEAFDALVATLRGLGRDKQNVESGIRQLCWCANANVCVNESECITARAALALTEKGEGK